MKNKPEIHWPNKKVFIRNGKISKFSLSKIINIDGILFWIREFKEHEYAIRNSKSVPEFKHNKNYQLWTALKYQEI